MSTASLTLVCVLVFLPADIQSVMQSPPVSEASIIDWIRSSDEQVRQGAVAYVLRHLSPDHYSEHVDRALADELGRLTRLATSRHETLRAGGTLHEDFPAEYHANLIEALSRSRRPLVIEPLAGALGTGRLAEEGIAKFGEQAIPHLVRVARLRVGSLRTGAPGDTPPDVVAGALNSLRRLMSSHSSSISAKGRAEVLAVAMDRLRGSQEGVVVASAARLAVATGDRSARQRVEQLARDASSVATLVNPSDTALVQRAAQEALTRRGGL